MNWYKVAFLGFKVASMDVVVDGFTPDKKWDTILEMGHNCYFCVDKNIQLLNSEEKAAFQALRGPDLISPDGDYAFEPTGIMNFYVGGMKKEVYEVMVNCIIQTLKSQNITVSKWWPEPFGQERAASVIDRLSYFLKEMQEDLKNAEPETIDFYRKSVADAQKKLQMAEKYLNPESIRVVRIQISENKSVPQENVPPEINLANGNAILIFRDVLGLPYDSGFWSLDAQKISRQITYLLGEKTLQSRQPSDLRHYVPTPGEEWKAPKTEFGPFGSLPARPSEEYDPNNKAEEGQWGMRMVDQGYSSEDVKERLTQIKQVADWAINNGYKTISVV
jgi:hypothetical protein